jgi:SAM-dependent methyltransferase
MAVWGGLRAGLRQLELSARRRLGLDDHARVFDRIYQQNDWLVGSGPGSTPENTVAYRTFLQRFMREHGVKSVLDIGSGDWQSSRLIDWTGITYHGFDVSETAVALARQHATADIKFTVGNAVCDVLPSADLLIAKDVLQHWSNHDIAAFVAKLSSYRLALFTNGHPPRHDHKTNVDIRPGKGRPIDLAAAPFHLPGDVVFQYDGDEPKRVFLWTRDRV